MGEAAVDSAQEREPALEQKGQREPEQAPETPAPAPETRAPAPGARRRKGRGRGKKIALAAAVLLLAGVGATAATLGLGGRASGDQAAGELPPNTAEVTRRTLKDTQSVDGQLGFGPAATLAARRPGTVTGAPEAGDRITRGQALYEADGRPVTLMYGSTPAYRPMKTGTEGVDVRQLEKNLSALGYTGFTVDDEYTAATAEAVRAWQEDLGLAETGSVELGSVVFAPGAVRVDSVAARKGDTVGPGGKVLSYTATEQAVTVELDPADQRLAKEGREVEVVLPDDRTVKGTVQDVATVIEPGNGQGEEAKTKVEVVVGFKDEVGRKAADAYTLAAVHVDFASETREDVLTVPVGALLALAEGGFGVEVVHGSTSSYVPVTTGLFADGRVEISGEGIAEGTKVGVPK
ncbi:peptidoglycan-binding domain-containing protein [Streptomyces sp. ME19-01-6]|uniref:peptidoglycan-binding domain-containing protein n=1 Tax=Streptomyces sp. ME19-01-6 TaxID=3028686 RepID=UPI0029A2D39C|nr:peptidoglycan-binding domain-containing protein [Streptomyces sp. ME19-01-6]MDX3226792.1 peptidoglycan-binding domain-containing protein [Streptomyces sp. ME19-01-6]